MKVCLLIAALSMGKNIEEACAHAGITRRQYIYFAELHPVIHQIRKNFKSDLVAKARLAVSKRVEVDPKFALRFLSKTKPGEFPRPPPLQRIAALESEIEEMAQDFHDQHNSEIRKLKFIIGAYRELVGGLRLEGGQKRSADALDAEIRAYNHLHKSNSVRIRRVR